MFSSASLRVRLSLPLFHLFLPLSFSLCSLVFCASPAERETERETCLRLTDKVLLGYPCEGVFACVPLFKGEKGATVHERLTNEDLCKGFVDEGEQQQKIPIMK